MSSSYMLIVTVVATFLSLSASYPTGAPPETCGLFTANHAGHSAQDSVPNYSLSTAPSSVSSGGSITVTLRGTNGETLKGFFIQGQDQTTKEPVGKFLAHSEAQTRDCSGSDDSATHVNANEKARITLQWQAPADYKGTVVFRAVVVKNYENFWNNIYSNSLTVV